MGYWARAPQAREQLVLIATTLDDRIPEDHPVRAFAEILDGYDWSAWEGRYHGKLGQPPIHPSVLAGAWLYALRRGVRSSRKVEYMIGHNIDFMWLVRGHAVDHTTLSEFRSNFAVELKDLFRYVARIAMAAGLLELVDVATDGTRVKANNSRYQTWTADRIAAALEELVKAFDQKLAESQTADAQDDGLGTASLDKLPPELAEIAPRQAHLKEIQQRLHEADAARQKDGIDPRKNPAQIPRHDTDARVLPNKEGGYAPNYTPFVTTEGRGGFIVDATVIVGNVEHTELLPSVDRVIETCGEKPAHVLADGAFATGPNIVGMEARGIEFFSHLPMPAVADNPAIRPDPTQPVAEADRDRLPISPQTRRLDKACFVYDAAADLYYCPQGQPLAFETTKSEIRHGEKSSSRVYRCTACDTCPLKPKCVSDKNKGGRTVSRDTFTADRERFARQMQTEAARKTYDQRMRIGETPFALIKHVLGLRQFLLRGLEKVQTEWLWTCTAVNLDKLATGLRRIRAAMATPMAAEVVN